MLPVLCEVKCLVLPVLFEVTCSVLPILFEVKCLVLPILFQLKCLLLPVLFDNVRGEALQQHSILLALAAGVAVPDDARQPALQGFGVGAALSAQG